MLRKKVNYVFLLCLGSILNWSEVFSHRIPVISIEHGDIVATKVDVIVNAANKELQGGGGVCGAIFGAAGWQNLQKTCDAFQANKGIRCATGEAVITPSFDLTKKGISHIIHAVGPDCRIISDKKERKKLLKSAYRKSLDLASDNNLTSIAFPFISSAIYAYPKKEAAKIAVKTVLKYVRANQTSLEKVVFVLFSQEDTKLFGNTLANEKKLLKKILKKSLKA